MKRNPGKMPDYRPGTKTFPERLLRVLRPVFEGESRNCQPGSERASTVYLSAFSRIRLDDCEKLTAEIYKYFRSMNQNWQR